jgi:LmbE family N-acetylglucosaminyl deacetylase
MNVALVVAAHPDDEVLGCGATIARLVSDGWAVHVIILAEGATSRSNKRDLTNYELELSLLTDSAQKAHSILGSTSLKFFSLPDNRMDGMELLDVIKFIEAEISYQKPCLVLTHHAGDVNVDHRVIHDAVITACRPIPECSVRTLLFFEVPSSTEWRPTSSGKQFEPDYFYDVTNFLHKKLEALTAYSSELRDFPHPRSLEAVEYLAKWRGATIGCSSAEAFMLGRVIV